MSNSKKGISLNKYISDSGYCSRREADLYIESGMVLINGKEPIKSARVMPGDKVIVNGQKIKPKASEKDTVIALFKPKGINCTIDRKVKNNVLDFMGYAKTLFPIGGLDKASEGMLLLTNKQELANKLSQQIENEYVVSVNRDITPQFIESMELGVKVGNKTITVSSFRQLGKTEFGLTTKKEINRQIRKMCQAQGYYVRSIVRVRILGIDLKNLQLGRWRFLSDAEIATLLDGKNTEKKKRIGKTKART